MLLKINVNKSVGPDGLHPMLLKELAECLAAPITALFNSSLEKELFLMIGKSVESFLFIRKDPIKLLKMTGLLVYLPYCAKY